MGGQVPRQGKVGKVPRRRRLFVFRCDGFELSVVDATLIERPPEPRIITRSVYGYNFAESWSVGLQSTSQEWERSKGHALVIVSLGV